MLERNWKGLASLIVVGALSLCALALGQQAKKPLTNSDVLKMVKGGVPESVILSSIQSSPAKFDLSPDALVALHKAGVSQKVMDAMVAAAGGRPPADGAAPPSGAGAPQGGASAAQPNKSKSHIPSVNILQNGTAQKMSVEKTQLAQTKNKPTSMAKLAADTALLQSFQSTMSSAAAGVASHVGSRTAGSALGQAGGALSSVLGQRKPKLTYVWAIPNPASTNVLSTDTPEFSVNFSSVPGVSPDDFEPAIVKLTPAQNAWRLVGATQGKEDATASFSADWQIYSSFLEEQVKIKSRKLGPGQYQISPASPLVPGEYGVVLRPISKSKKFSGGDVARAQGEGLMFDSVWSFQVPPDAEEQ